MKNRVFLNKGEIKFDFIKQTNVIDFFSMSTKPAESILLFSFFELVKLNTKDKFKRFFSFEFQSF